MYGNKARAASAFGMMQVTDRMKVRRDVFEMYALSMVHSIIWAGFSGHTMLTGMMPVHKHSTGTKMYASDLSDHPLLQPASAVSVTRMLCGSMGFYLYEFIALRR